MKEINGVLMSEEECFLKHNGLIYKALSPFLPSAHIIGVDQEDLISEGKIGFIKAYRKFDETLGYRFSSFAIKTIKYEAMKYIRDKGKSVKYSREIIELANKINASGLSELTSKEIAFKLNESEKKVRAAFESMKSVESLNAEVFRDSEKVSLLDQLGSEADYTAIYVKDFIELLEPVEQSIVSMRLEDLTQVEIGHVFGVSQVQISRRIKMIGEKYLKHVN